MSSRPPHGAAPARAGAAGATLALLRGCLRYWPAVALHARAQLARCERAAQAIPEARLRSLALAKLRRERFNPEVAATFATLAPRSARALVTQATVCLQVAYDHLDLLTESPQMSRAQADRLLGALPAAVAGEPWRAPAGFAEDGGYLDSILAPVRRALHGLPAAAAVRGVAIRSASRCAEAQALHHCGTEDELRRFSQGLAGARSPAQPMGWQEALAAGSASVLCLHALIAAAADPQSTPAHAEQLESLYSSIGALAMLDSLIDRSEDRACAQRGYLERYASEQEMADRLASIARQAVAEAQGMRHGAHHLMTLGGLIAYYCSAPAAARPPGRIVRARLQAELGPLLSGPMAVMRAWRAMKAGRRAARCIVSRSQRSAPASAAACSGGSWEAEARGFHARPLGEGGS